MSPAQRNPRGRGFWFLPLLLLGACALQETDPDGPVAGGLTDDDARSSRFLFQAATSIQDDWSHMRMRGETDYQLTIFDKTLAIRARGQDSASALIRPVDVDLVACPEIEWAWAATKVQKSVNLREKDGEDVAASLFLIFGDPGLYSDPDPVPTLRYVWTTDHVPLGEVIDNPYLSGLVKSIAVRNTPRSSGSEVKQQGLIVEHRNIQEDFQRAFGHPPAEGLKAIAIFSDNDQTHEPVEAYYGWARMICKTGQADPSGIADW